MFSTLAKPSRRVHSPLRKGFYCSLKLPRFNKIQFLPFSYKERGFKSYVQVFPRGLVSIGLNRKLLSTGKSIMSKGRKREEACTPTKLYPSFTTLNLYSIELLEDLFNLLGTQIIIVCISSTSFIAERK